MIRGTTPTFTFTIKKENLNLNEALTVLVTIKQSGKRFDFSGDRLAIDGRTVSLWFTQQESMKFTEGIPASVQINWTYPNPNGGSPRRAATKPKSFAIDEQFHERVIE